MLGQGAMVRQENPGTRENRSIPGDDAESLARVQRPSWTGDPGSCLFFPPQAEGGPRMRIVKIEDLHADAGWRVTSFLKLTTDEGLVGWSEFYDGFGAGGVTDLVR